MEAGRKAKALADLQAIGGRIKTLRARLDASGHSDSVESSVAFQLAAICGEGEAMILSQPDDPCEGTPYELDGAIKCFDCGALWGAVSNPDPKTHQLVG